MEVGELGDLHAVQPHLPAQTPRAQRWSLPVVFHESDVVLAALYADGLQALQVQFLWIARIWLEDHLVLEEHLHTVGVLAVAPVVSSVGRLDVGHVPRLRAEDAQRGGRVHGARAHLLAVRLPDEASVLRPELL